MILLDTHAAIWLASKNPALGDQSLSMAIAAREENRLAISAISFWEIAILVSKDRLELREAPATLRENLLNTGVSELPLTGDIAPRSNWRISTAIRPTASSWQPPLRTTRR